MLSLYYNYSVRVADTRDVVMQILMNSDFDHLPCLLDCSVSSIHSYPLADKIVAQFNFVSATDYNQFLGYLRIHDVNFYTLIKPRG